MRNLFSIPLVGRGNQNNCLPRSIEEILQNNQHGSRIAQQRGLGGFPHERLLQDSRGNRTISSRQNSNQLIDRAKQLYQDEQYVEASKVWQQTVTLFKQQRDILNQAMALSNLALTQQKLGDWQAAEGAIASSLKLLQTQSQTETQQRILANTLDIQGSLERSRGKSQTAFETWEQAAQIYQELDNDRAIVKNQINQAQALQDLGYYRRASKILRDLRENKLPFKEE